MKNTIRIGTRNSPLALWQAQEVAQALEQHQYRTEICPIVSSGDKNLNQPLYAMGITGVFTKDLDWALLNSEIDIAVHSLKDVPTQLPQNISLWAYLERDFPQDVLVRAENTQHLPLHELKIATSSLRRRAFWLREFKDTAFVDIRGNVQTRLKKLSEGIADATLFSLAGIKRLNLDLHYEPLHFMLPAPAQGVVTIAGRTDDADIAEALQRINHQPTQKCVEIERLFLQTLEGGCTAPIGAFAEFIDDDTVRFRGQLTSLNGKDSLEIEEVFKYEPHQDFGYHLAQDLLNRGGKGIMQSIKQNLP